MLNIISKNFVQPKFLKYCIHLIFLIITIWLFKYLNTIQPNYFVDEVFHIPQTLQYCNGNFTHWNPKITTLPGLYIVTALILTPFDLCDNIYIRCTNLIGTFGNLALSYYIINAIEQTDKKNRWNNWLRLAVSYNIAFFPPLFFWFFLYYTDVLSVNIVLLMLLSHLKKNLKLAAFAGFLSLLVRQTNIIWVVFIAVETVTDSLEDFINKSKSSYKKFYNKSKYMNLLWQTIRDKLCTGSFEFLSFIIQIVISVYPYILVGLISLIFIIWNKGIVVGDHSAHTTTIHIPQFFYFSLFLSGFLWPYTLPHYLHYFHTIKKHWIITSASFAVLTIIVHNNTLVHPYVLADNRHYVFYIWSKFMGRYAIFKYLLIPLYSFSIYVILCNISHLRFTTQINYLCCICLVIIPQLLLEPRYFILPYIFYRLMLQKPKRWQVLMESLTIFIINLVQFFVFVNKTFYWQDLPDPQRIGW
ncbi:dol-P-Glc:Glc(2)Man(9)GlcNAc(2)-PP-Dol alpha-1,2-glucosyltransferase [Prorops nasuta]|uniref:dol-P-Glc:Glc(2)Man(9)GlcNAc(2)-PP-Dol alpha-1,2-glucosyltransferase n=1 Tax=Prorops nasuta TaxID=863751 RepID=UPI0034CF1DD2